MHADERHGVAWWAKPFLALVVSASICVHRRFHAVMLFAVARRSTLDSDLPAGTILAACGGAPVRNPFRLARYGLGTLWGVTVILAAAGAALWIYLHPWAAAAPGALFLFCLYFFRDPDRTLPDGEDLILSPADGTVVDIEEMAGTDEGPEFVGGRAVRVGIFLSIFSCHVNRAPLSGVVRLARYRRGKFLAAFNKRASAENESNFLGIETDHKLSEPRRPDDQGTRAYSAEAAAPAAKAGPTGEPLRIAVKQISGVIARRIVSTAKEGDALSRGERFGMIKFGSRTELYLPAESVAELTVKVGDRVRGGASVIGRLGPRTLKEEG